MHYTQEQIERVARIYFKFPPGWHTVESKDGTYWCEILVGTDGKILECIGQKKGPR